MCQSAMPQDDAPQGLLAAAAKQFGAQRHIVLVPLSHSVVAQDDAHRGSLLGALELFVDQSHPVVVPSGHTEQLSHQYHFVSRVFRPVSYWSR